MLKQLVVWEQGHRKAGKGGEPRQELVAPDGDEQKLLQLLGYVE